MKKFLKNGPPSIMLGALTAVAALLLLAVGIHAQQNIVTMFGCTSITNCIQANNIPILVDSAGRPQVKVTGAIGPLTIPVTINGSALGTTSTDGVILQNTTAATSGATVQISPRMKWCGSAWNSVGLAAETNCFFTEILPATVAGTTTATFKIGYIAPGGAVTYPFTVKSNGDVTALLSGTFDSLTVGTTGNAISLAAAANILWTGRSTVNSTADKLISALDNGKTTGMEVNLSAATLGTCTGGTITTGSHSTAGGYTGNTSSSCVVNFSTSWTNAPFCVAMSIASTTHPRVSATATGSITITGGVSGEAITYHCWGRIGT